MIALVCQRLARVVCALPPGAASPQEGKDMARAHAPVRHPTAGWDRGSAALPVRDAMDPPGDLRGMEGHSMDQPQAMEPPDRALMACIIGPVPRMLCRLSRLEHKGMIAFLDAQDRVASVGWQRLDGRRMRTAAVCGDEAREVRVGLAPCDDQPGGGMACTSICVRPVVLPTRCRPPWHPGTHVGRAERGAHHLRRLRDRTVTRHRVPTRGTVHGRGGQIPRAIQGEEVVASETHPLCKRLATLEVAQDALAPGAEPRGCEGSKSRAPVCVARDTLHPVARVHMALGSLLVKGEERGRLESKQGARRHEGSRQGHVDIRTARVWEIGAAAADHVQERSGREMLPYGRRHARPRTPRHENSTIILVRGYGRIEVYERPVQLTR
jgi:hypothetical protein